MASPELWKGLCGVCIGPLTPETTLYEDCGDGRGGVHKGICAYMAGYVAPEHQLRHDELLTAILVTKNGSVANKVAHRAYRRWLQSLGLEDHYWV